MQHLSSKRQRVLRAIAEHQLRGDFPLVRELAAELGLAGESSLTRTLEALVEERYLQRQGGGSQRRQRIYTLTTKGQSAVLNCFEPRAFASQTLPVSTAQKRIQLKGIPVVGWVQAGPWAEIQSYPEPNYRDDLGADSAEFCALDVRGDSMIGALIAEGDCVVMRRQDHAAHGQIAVVEWHRADGRSFSTLKVVELDNRGEIKALRPANPEYLKMPVAEMELQEGDVVKVHSVLHRVVRDVH
ncbi:MAG TPA: S24 family peptidase [Abditibacteriaceae bacterium]|jgi:repressor LexA